MTVGSNRYACRYRAVQFADCSTSWIQEEGFMEAALYGALVVILDKKMEDKKAGDIKTNKGA